MFNSKPVLRKYFWENDNLKAPSSDLVLHFYSDGGLPKDRLKTEKVKIRDILMFYFKTLNPTFPTMQLISVS